MEEIEETDFYETPAANQLATAYRKCQCGCPDTCDWLFLICIFLALYI